MTLELERIVGMASKSNANSENKLLKDALYKETCGMTYEQLRKLDSQVARKVFGWKWISVLGADGLMPNDYEPGVEAHEVAEAFSKDPLHYVPKYSTQIEDAWAIVEELGMSIEPAGKQWRASVESGESAIAGSPEIAICRCALRVRAFPMFRKEAKKDA